MPSANRSIRQKSIGDQAVEELLTEPTSLWRAARELFLGECALRRAEGIELWDALSESDRIPFAQRALVMTREAAAAYAHIPAPLSRLAADDRLLSLGG